MQRRAAPLVPVLTAAGDSISHHGGKQLQKHTMSEKKLDLSFRVMDVSRAILSVSKLREQGFASIFGEKCYIEYPEGHDCRG